MTNCKEFRDIVHDLVRGEALDAVAVEEAFAHAESCDACDAVLEEAESLTGALRSLAAHHAHEQAPPRVEKALLKELEQKRIPSAASSNQRRFFLAGATGIAAAAVLLISLLMLHRSGTQSSSSPPSQTAASVAADTSDDFISLPIGEGTSSADGAATSDESFIPLSETFDPSSLEDGTVVRVVLSHAALESFGVPLNETGDEQVVADLIVTNDGVPQAIHVVGW